MAFVYEIHHPDLKEITFDLVREQFAARELLDADGNPLVVTVATADPADAALFPFVGINLLSDAESATHVGDSIADEFVEDEGEVYAGASSIFSQQVECKLWTTNAEERDFLGRILKETLLIGRGTSANPGPFVVTPGVTNVRITGGHDEGISQTAEAYSPHPLYMRTYMLSATTELTIQEPAGPALGELIVDGEGYDADPLAELEIDPFTGE
jgi:hypothetical protein